MLLPLVTQAVQCDSRELPYNSQVPSVKALLRKTLPVRIRREVVPTLLFVLLLIVTQAHGGVSLHHMTRTFDELLLQFSGP